MSDNWKFMDWAAVRDAYPKVATATEGGKEYAIWEQHDGYQVAQRSVSGRRVRWHQTAYRLPSIAEAITQAEQWAFALRCAA